MQIFICKRNVVLSLLLEITQYHFNSRCYCAGCNSSENNVARQQGAISSAITLDLWLLKSFCRHQGLNHPSRTIDRKRYEDLWSDSIITHKDGRMERQIISVVSTLISYCNSYMVVVCRLLVVGILHLLHLTEEKVKRLLPPMHKHTLCWVQFVGPLFR